MSVPSLDTTPTRIITNQGPQSSHNVTVGSLLFQFTRITSVAESPLKSQLQIDNVIVEINGTRLFCSTDGDTNNALMSRIHVIENIISKIIHIMYNIYILYIILYYMTIII